MMNYSVDWDGPGERDDCVCKHVGYCDGSCRHVRPTVRDEIMRLMREDFDPTPPNWEGRDWDDNAEDVADKIIAVALSEKPTQVSDAWKLVKQWLSDYAAEEAAFSRYRDDVVLDGVMTAGTMRALNDALYVQAEVERGARK